MFRNIEPSIQRGPSKDYPQPPSEAKSRLEDPISDILAPLVQCALNSDTEMDGAEPDLEGENGHAELHKHYICEMWYICITHTLVDAPDVHLKEEEVVLGTILANCAWSRWRSDRTYRMKLHVEDL
jgi:hypothetical protein